MLHIYILDAVQWFKCGFRCILILVNAFFGKPFSMADFHVLSLSDCLSHLWPLISWPLDSYVMHFEGDDMVAYSLPDGHSRTLQDHYALNFKTLEKDGVLLYSEGIQGDSVMLELKTGRLYLHMSLGKEWSKATGIENRFCCAEHDFTVWFYRKQYSA